MVKVLDFGLAKLTESRGNGQTAAGGPPAKPPNDYSYSKAVMTITRNSTA